MSEPVKKKRIRAADLLKTSRCSGAEKYDFSKIKDLKGKSGRDTSKKGRPEGITGIATTSRQIDHEPYIESTEEDIRKIDPPTSNTQYDPDSICFLSQEETYINLLKENNGIYCVDDTYMTFVMHGIDFQRLRLKSSQFLFLSRRAMTFLGDSHFIYTCSCDVAGRDLIQCCDEQMDVPFDEFTSRYPGCLHANVLSASLEQFDAQNMIEPSNFDEMDVDVGTDRNQVTEDEIIEMENGLYLVKSQKGMGVVDGTKCITCNVNVVKCIHLTIFLNTHEKHEHISKTYVYKQKCYSVSSIPFHSNVNMTDMFKKSVTDRFSFENDSSTVLLKPNAEICDSCNSHLVEKEQTNKASIFVMNQILDAIVSVKECVACEKQFYVDGLDLGVINMGRNLVCHEILRRFMYYFLTGKTTIFTEYSVLKKTFIDAGFQNFSGIMSYQDFKEAWYSFLDLLDIDYQNSFHCPDCGPDPETVVMDATSVSFRKEMISHQSLFSGSNDISEPYDKADSSRVKERTLFSRAVRLNLLDYIKPKGIHKDIIEKTLNLVKIENENNAIVDLLNIIFKNSIVKGDRYFSTDVWRNFIRALASSYPFCSFLPPSEDFFDFLESVFSEPISNVLRNDNYLRKIQTTVPVIFKLLSHMKENFPCQEFKNCLPYFKNKVFYPFLKDICPSDEPDEEDGLSYFPSLPKVRRRGQFYSDKKRSQVKDDVCSKLSKGHPSLLPGVFTLFCPHGICYGFQVMKCHESPDVPFTLLRTRFRKAPKLVIYDNACSLQAYCLNRDAQFFSDTQFRVDGLHFKNHTACGPSFELKSYPQYSELNSQVVEQSNSRLQRVKGSLSYMTQSNFMKHCKYYLWGQNDEILSKTKKL